MPIFEYRCKSCGEVSEFLVSSSQKSHPLNCKQCGSPQLEKMISVSHPLRGEKRTPGHTCCGKEERCSTPPCSADSFCRRD